jgi:hypothetical protein
MTFFTQAPTGVSRLDELESAPGEVLSAKWQSAMLRQPLPSAGRALELCPRGIIAKVPGPAAE